MKTPPGIIRVTIEATDLDEKQYRLVKVITFTEAREVFDHFLQHMGQEWMRDFHGWPPGR
jgi:hypothetical protein